MYLCMLSPLNEIQNVGIKGLYCPAMNIYFSMWPHSLLESMAKSYDKLFPQAAAPSCRQTIGKLVL